MSAWIFSPKALVPDLKRLNPISGLAKMFSWNSLMELGNEVLKAALGGDLDRVKRVVRLGVFVNSTDDFHDQPKVANGVSDLMVEVFGDAGKHARSAVGVNTLPLNVAVEVDAIFEVG